MSSDQFNEINKYFNSKENHDGCLDKDFFKIHDSRFLEKGILENKYWHEAAQIDEDYSREILDFIKSIDKEIDIQSSSKRRLAEYIKNQYKDRRLRRIHEALLLTTIFCKECDIEIHCFKKSMDEKEHPWEIDTRSSQKSSIIKIRASKKANKPYESIAQDAIDCLEFILKLLSEKKYY